jgi:hypothetical protein
LLARRTVSLLPGSLTVVYCSSLYFLNAGSNAEASPLASALMSSWRLEWDREHVGVTTHTGHDIGKLRRSALDLSCLKDFSYRPLPVVPTRRTMLLLPAWKPLFEHQHPHKVAGAERKCCCSAGTLVEVRLKPERQARQQQARDHTKGNYEHCLTSIRLLR